MRRRAIVAAIGTVVALALSVGGCGGDESDDPAATPPPSETPFGDGRAPPPDASQLPAEFIECMASQGYEIRSTDEMHAAPQQALQACFGSLHSGGGTP